MSSAPQSISGVTYSQQHAGTSGEADLESGAPATEATPLLSARRHDTRRCTLTPNGRQDILQFSAPIYYADENEEQITIEVIRLGLLKGECSASFSTHDGTATHSVQYVGTSGTVTFQHGEHTKTITVKGIDDATWSPSTEFKMCLADPDGCKLGLHLHTVRVKILNRDTFPSNEYQKQVQQGADAIENIGDWRLFLSYLKFNYHTAGVRWQTVVSLLFDQLSNCALFVTLFVGVYMVDTLFARGTSSSKRLVMSDRYQTAVLIALWYVVPTVVLYAWDACKVNMDIRGTSRKFLQDCMMRTFLQYSSASRDKVSSTDLIVNTARSADAVACAYVAAINIAQCLGKIFVVALFIVAFQPDLLAVGCVVIMPGLLLLFAMYHVRIFEKEQKKVDMKLKTLMLLCSETCAQYRLIAEYFKRHLVSETFAKSVDEHTKAMIPESSTRLHAVYITKFISGCFIAIYIVSRAQRVFDNELSLGLFLATITIFGTYLADAISDLNDQLNIIIESFTSIQEFTLYLNLPLELSSLKQFSRERIEATTKMRIALMKEDLADGVLDMESATDAIPLTLVNLSVRNCEGQQVLKDVNMSVEQGRMIAIIGPHASGKRLFLETMSDMLLPAAGSIFVPSHLRLLHVSRNPMFLRMSLTHNLSLGLPSHTKVNIARVKTIMRMLDLEDLIPVVDAEMRIASPRLSTDNEMAVDVGDAHEMADQNPKVLAWLDPLSHSTRAKLHIARALIDNPNVMVLQRPLHHFNEDVGNQILHVIRLHVESRGLGYPEDSVHSRRPRTVFFVPDSAAQATQADTIWQIDRKTHSVFETQKGPAMITPRTIHSSFCGSSGLRESGIGVSQAIRAGMFSRPHDSESTNLQV